MVGEEKRITEELKRQKEIDCMYEIMNAKANTFALGSNKDFTFDFEGKVL